MNTFPLYARIAFERLESDSKLRTQEMLSNLCESYAWQYLEVPSPIVFKSLVTLCALRFPDFKVTA